MTVPSAPSRTTEQDETQCGCGHPNRYHYFEGRCGWNGNSVRCNCEAFSAVIGYETLQFSGGGIWNGRNIGPPIHLVRCTVRGTPGPTLCGFDRFAKGGPGWSVGGGYSGDFDPCEECDRNRDHSLPVRGSLFGSLFPVAR